MRRLIISAVLIAFSVTAAFAEYPPMGWTDSIVEGIDQAQREDKMLLLNFTGSDWCTWCIKLESEIFSTPEFEEWAENNLVRVFLDFPNGIKLPKETVYQNQRLQQYFGIRGYPTLIVFDSDLTPLLQTGYQEVEPAEYIRHLQKDRNIELASPEEFRMAFKKYIEENIASAKL